MHESEKSLRINIAMCSSISSTEKKIPEAKQKIHRKTNSQIQ